MLMELIISVSTLQTLTIKHAVNAVAIRKGCERSYINIMQIFIYLFCLSPLHEYR